MNDMAVDLPEHRSPNPHLMVSPSPLLVSPETRRPSLPLVRLSQDKTWLLWELAEEERQRVPMPTDWTGALEALIGVVRTPEDKPAVVAGRVLRVARRFGPLYMCRTHGKPASHLEECFLTERFREGGVEGISEWKGYAQEFGNLLEFGALLARAARGDSSLQELTHHPIWAEVEGYSGGIFDKRTGREFPVTLDDGAPWLQSRVEAMFLDGHVWPGIHWREKSRGFEFGFGTERLGLFGVALLQLALELGGATRWLRCSGCARVYLRPVSQKLPRRGDLNFCQACFLDKALIRRVQRQQADPGHPKGGQP